MSDRFITYVIIGVAFGFTQLWFAYWVVKLYKEKQRILKERRAGGAATRPSARSGPAREHPSDAGSGAGSSAAKTPTAGAN